MLQAPNELKGMYNNDIRNPKLCRALEVIKRVRQQSFPRKVTMVQRFHRPVRRRQNRENFSQLHPQRIIVLPIVNGDTHPTKINLDRRSRDHHSKKWRYGLWNQISLELTDPKTTQAFWSWAFCVPRAILTKNTNLKFPSFISISPFCILSSLPLPYHITLQNKAPFLPSQFSCHLSTSYSVSWIL